MIPGLFKKPIQGAQNIETKILHDLDWNEIDFFDFVGSEVIKYKPKEEKEVKTVIQYYKKVTESSLYRILNEA